MAQQHDPAGPAIDVSEAVTPQAGFKTTPIATELAPREQRAIYELMVLARALDDRQLILNRQGRQGIHLSARGHEASGAASAFALDPERDILVPSHRSLGAVLAIGLTPREILLGCLSKATDPASGGRSMPNHYSHAGRRVLSMSSPIGTQIPHAVGAALAAKVRRHDAVVLVSFGDGAASKADFHEGLTFAAVRCLPVVFLCENNGWSISVPVERQMAVRSVAERGPAYGMPGVAVDGADPLAVFRATRVAVDRARAGEGPTLIESRVERLAPHSSDDDDTRYRSERERAAAERRDPVPRFGRELRARALLDDATEAAMWQRARAAVDAALAFAEQAPAPAAETAFDHVFCRPASVGVDDAVPD
jgi:2-oxoisovalerate dehydrogenase E1 component alpha subunit